MSSFLFCIVPGLLLETQEERLNAVDNPAKVLAILDEVEIQWAKDAFDVATEILQSINIITIPRKSHILAQDSSTHMLSSDLD